MRIGAAAAAAEALFLGDRRQGAAAHPASVAVSTSMAERLWPGEDAIGKQISLRDQWRRSSRGRWRRSATGRC